MNGPAKNRLHDYEAGWLTLLLRMGVAEENDLYAAQNRVAQAAIDEKTSGILDDEFKTPSNRPRAPFVPLFRGRGQQYF